MCGFFGGIGLQNISISNLKKITDPIKNRGPDDFKVWIDDKIQYFMAFRRLSILDLTSLGSQPMISSNKKWAMMFNGEIYNHLSLKKYLKSKFNIYFKGESDSEVLIKSFELLGVEQTLKFIDGMYSISLYNIPTKTTYLIRDKLGQKPLYFYRNNDVFLYMSDLSIINNLNLKKTIDIESVNYFLKLGYIPLDKCIYYECKKVNPGSFVKFTKNEQIEIFNYWQPNYLDNHNQNSLSQNTEILDQLFDISTKQTMQSNVEIGSFLSGGIDSSLTSVFMQKNSLNRIKTFSIGYDDDQYNELEDSKKISKIISSEHHELVIKPKDIVDLIPNLYKIYSEPFSDSSQIPTYIISKFASKKIKVALSGDGADELFGGYNRYQYTNNFFQLSKYIPKDIKDIFINLTKKLIKIKSFNKLNYENIDRLENIFKSKDIENLYLSFISNNFTNKEIDILNNDFLKSNQIFKSNFQNIAYFDLKNYLPNDILCKVDRASMSNSLECRTPFLNNEIIDFALNIPDNQKLNYSNNKIILRELLNKYVPKEYIKKKKQGFSIPISKWLSVELCDWSESLLDNIEINSYIDFDIVDLKNKWQEHKKGKRNWGKYLWSHFILQDWFDNVFKK